LRKKIFVAILVFAFLLQTFSLAFANAAAPDEVEKVVFVHYANNAKARPPPQETGTYKLMGIKWATLQVPFAVNTANSGIDEATVKSTILLAANEWDDGKYSYLLREISGIGTKANLFADYTDSSVPTTAKTAAYDGTNCIFWGSITDSNTIAVTTVWYTRISRQILEFDMEFNTYYTWTVSPNGVSGTMDLQNIATHELGHSVGLADLYTASASKETMYGYSSYAVTSARDLYLGDQAGIVKLYG
jgi:hypothetical protein